MHFLVHQRVLSNDVGRRLANPGSELQAPQLRTAAGGLQIRGKDCLRDTGGSGKPASRPRSLCHCDKYSEPRQQVCEIHQEAVVDLPTRDAGAGGGLQYQHRQAQTRRGAGGRLRRSEAHPFPQRFPGQVHQGFRRHQERHKSRRHCCLHHPQSRRALLPAGRRRLLQKRRGLLQEGRDATRAIAADRIGADPVAEARQRRSVPTARSMSSRSASVSSRTAATSRNWRT